MNNLTALHSLAIDLNKFNTGIDIIRTSISLDIFNDGTNIFSIERKDISLYEIFKIVNLVKDDIFSISDIVFGMNMTKDFIEGEVFGIDDNLYTIRINMI